jgi:hypothetical protein
LAPISKYLYDITIKTIDIKDAYLSWTFSMCKDRTDESDGEATEGGKLFFFQFDGINCTPVFNFHTLKCNSDVNERMFFMKTFCKCYMGFELFTNYRLFLMELNFSLLPRPISSISFLSFFVVIIFFLRSPSMLLP